MSNCLRDKESKGHPDFHVAFCEQVEQGKGGAVAAWDGGR